MMLRALLFASCTLVALVSGQADASLTSRAACKLTSIPKYEFTCNQRGWVQDPQLLKLAPNITSNGACGALCLKDPKCKSLRYVKGSRKCYMYSKRLKDMFTDYSNAQPGILNEPYCFSNNCNEISACSVDTSECDYFSYFFTDGASYRSRFRRYACSYGHTARHYGFDTTTALFNGSLSVCDAALQCTSLEAPDYGSFDIHFHIPSGKWECVLFHEIDYFHFTGYNKEPVDERISPSRYSVRNDSIGAGYGFWMTYGAYDECRDCYY